MQLPDVNIYGTTFFDHGSTYLGLLQDAFFVISYLSLNWGLFQGGAQKAFGISAKTQCLYALAYTFRLVEYYPYDHWSYDLLKCIVFSIFLWFSFASINFFSPGCDHDCNKVDTFWLHFTVGLTSVIAYAKGYDHLPTTGRIYFWAWCNYLEGVAILPQMWLLLNFKRRDLISKGIWLGLHFMTVSRVFQLLHWTFLHYDQEMLDKVAVASAVFHVAVYFLFQITLILKDTIKSKPEMTLPVTEPSDGDTLSS
ncbi:ER lumen protein-retaining receptor 3 [Orchesella cincta]|uniref:ER lumen protein-retaining receptor 3 n=1 Tax=Orchesella cincta TaxID=48709 RepID=A0A1D2NK78_ORCCI|nr:ER lumen protein-retaining receptor 3 [Orchesella cincta]